MEICPRLVRMDRAQCLRDVYCLRKKSEREEEMDYSNLFVVLMGLGTVFAGLLCIILLVSLMSWVCTRTAGTQTPPKAAVPAAPAAAETVSPAMIAAVSAAIAEDLGTDVSAIRIVSMKKV